MSFFLLTACQQVGEGVQAVFGPSNPVLGAHVHSICDALDLPHIEARVDLEPATRELSINLHPAQSLLNAAYLDVMAYLNWTRLAILYEEDYGNVSKNGAFIYFTMYKNGSMPFFGVIFL